VTSILESSLFNDDLIFAIDDIDPPQFIAAIMQAINEILSVIHAKIVGEFSAVQLANKLADQLQKQLLGGSLVADDSRLVNASKKTIHHFRPPESQSLNR
jgi:hypothetical protein